MDEHSLSVLTVVSHALDGCYDSLATLSDVVSEDFWKDIGEVMAGIDQAYDAIEYMISHPEDYS